MADFKMPFGAEFSPEKIDIIKLLKITMAYDGYESTEEFVKAVSKEYFKSNDTMGGNCKNSMVAYGILETGGGINLSLFGRNLSIMSQEANIYEEMAKNILTNLNGLMLIEAIKGVTDGGESPTLVNITEMLNVLGCEKLSKTNKSVPTMKKWLEKSGVLSGWNINQKRLENLIGAKDEEIASFKGLSHTQICFVRALCNCDTGNYQNAAKIRDLAKNSLMLYLKKKFCCKYY